MPQDEFFGNSISDSSDPESPLIVVRVENGTSVRHYQIKSDDQFFEDEEKQICGNGFAKELREVEFQPFKQGACDNERFLWRLQRLQVPAGADPTTLIEKYQFQPPADDFLYNQKGAGEIWLDGTGEDGSPRKYFLLSDGTLYENIEPAAGDPGQIAGLLITRLETSFYLDPGLLIYSDQTSA